MSEDVEEQLPQDNRQHDYHRGPVTLRRSAVPGTTTDQRLLDNAG